MLDRVAGPPSNISPENSPARLREAAGQFEALLLAQLLKSARQQGGWLGAGEDQAVTSMLEIAEEHLAAVLASQGGLGLAKLISDSLERTDPSDGRAGS